MPLFIGLVTFWAFGRGSSKPAHSALLSKYSFSREVRDSQGVLLRLTLSSDEKYRIWTPLSDISPALISATLTQEDRYFYVHPGVNPLSILRASFENTFFHRRLGASTITMQLVRLHERLRTRSIFGKLRQIVQALFLELLYSKEEILEAYLNIAPYGGNIEGVGAASLIYFSKQANLLTLSEAVSLAVIPQNPNARALAGRANEDFKRARAEIYKELQENEGSAAILREEIQRPRKLPFEAPHLVERALRERPFEDKLTITLDRQLQKSFERIVEQYIVDRSSRGVKNASALILRSVDNSVLAYVGSADYFAPEIAGQVDVVESKRSPGSALKPFIYALALEDGVIHPGTVLKDTQFSRSSYNPENFDKEFLGPIAATDALTRSRNSPAVALLNEIGPEKFLGWLKEAGVSALKEVEHYGLALALGGEELRLDELVSLYSGLANGGVFRPLRYFQDDNIGSAKKLLSPEVAFLVLEMLKSNARPEESLNRGQTGEAAQIPWKTGTSYGFRDAWAVGVVGEYTLGVWLGNADGKGNPEFVGRELAGPLFFRLADQVIKEKGFREQYLRYKGHAKKVRVCSISGELPGPHCHSVKTSWFIPGKSSIRSCSVHREFEVKNGYRLCPGASREGSEKVTYEVWPSDMLEVFRAAGLPRKQPPSYQPSCQGSDGLGKAPLISSPSPSLQYIATSNDFKIPLTSVLDGESKRAFWFVDDSFIAEVRAGESYFWSPPPGEYLVRVVDEQGRANSVAVKISAMP